MFVSKETSGETRKGSGFATLGRAGACPRYCRLLPVLLFALCTAFSTWFAVDLVASSGTKKRGVLAGLVLAALVEIAQLCLKQPDPGRG